MTLRQSFLFLSFFLSFYSLQAQCAINDLSVTPMACNNDNNFSVVIDFNFNEVGENGFTVTGNGLNHGTFEYSNLPITISQLPGNCVTDWEFVITDVDDSTCSAFDELGVICCTETCTMEIVDLTTGDCNLNDNTYSITFDLVTTGSLGVGFDVFANEVNIGFYTYDDLPLTLNFPWSGEITDELTVCENDNLDCCATMVMNSPCACNIIEMTADIIDCNETTEEFYVILDFDHTMTSDSFQLGGNNTNYGVFAYADLPITLGPIPFSSTIEYEFLVLDREDAFCFNFIEIGIIDDCVFECAISDLVVSPTECNGDGNFFVEMAFSAVNPGITGFTVQGNGTSYGTFEYGATSYNIGPLNGDCETIYEFVVIDQDDPTCMASTALAEPICCGQSCEIGSIEINAVCDGETLTGFNLNFDFSGNVSNSFHLALGEIELGSFNYADLPIQIIGSFDEGGHILHIVDSENESCSIFQEVVLICGTEACVISELEVEVGECNGDGMAMVTISFVVVNPGNDGFTITSGSEEFGTFLYGESSYTFGPVNGNCEEAYEFVIHDISKPDCELAFVEEICCNPCEINGLNVEAICEEGEQVGIAINFASVNTSDSFNLTINQDLIGTYAYSDIPLVLNPLAFAENEINVLVRDQMTESCAEDGSFNISCASECNINEVEYERTECENGLFNLVVNFNFSGTSNTFIIRGEMDYGPFIYDDLPVTISELEGDNTTEYIFEIIDSELEDCSALLEVGRVDCLENAVSDPLLEQLDIYNISRQLVINATTPINNLDLSFYTMDGKKVESRKLNLQSGRIMLDIPTSISNQIYLLSLRTEKGIKTIRLFAN